MGFPEDCGFEERGGNRRMKKVVVMGDSRAADGTLTSLTAARSIDAARSLLEERDRQDAKWGVQDHAPEWWLAILMEEVGELAQAVLETHFDNGPTMEHVRGTDNIRKEAVQCAAVAMAFIECIDRGPGRKG